MNNIDLNNIPLQPHKYDEIYLKNANRHRQNIHAINHNDNVDEKSIEEQDKEIINDIKFIKFDFMEFQDIKSDYNLDDEEDYIDKVVSEIDKINDEVMDLEDEIRKKRILMDKLRKIELNKRTQLSEVKIWISQNKLLWESFKLRWKEWNLECFIEFLKRIELKCSSFNEYYDGKDENCKIKIEKYMSDNTEKFNGSTIFNGHQHLPLLNELSLYRIGITNDKDCNIIYETIQKLIRFDHHHKAHHHHKKRHKKSSKKKKKSGKRKSHRKKKKQHIDHMDNDNKDHSAYESESDKSSEHIHDDNLYSFLKEIKLERYYVTLCEDGFDDIECLLELNKEDLMNLGMKNGHCKKLLKSIKMFSEKNQRHSIKSNGTQQIEGQHFYVSPK